MRQWLPQYLTSYSRWVLNRFRYRGVDIRQDTVIGGKCMFGRMCRIYPRAELIESSVGRYTYVGHGAKVIHTHVGMFCSLAPEVVVGGFIHPTSEFVSTSPAFFSPLAQCGTTFVTESKFTETKPTRVGNDVWIGYRAMILPGVTVHDGAIIGAAAVVTKDVPPYAIVAGVPARVMRSRFDEDVVAALLSDPWWNREEAWLRSHVDAFHSVQAVINALRAPPL